MIAKSWCCAALVGALSIGVSESVLAQIVPDNTLGAEGSVVTPNVNIQGIPSDRIDGGATRGANLFHSFQNFNVGEGRGAYFANPTGIENILTRVTGSNASNILGRLGVLGGANLFLLNPHGIVFGPNASLDLQGSFVATTAERIQLGDSGYFSAAEPQTSSLLSVSPGALFFSQVANQPTAIINQGNLSTGKHLTLSAGNLDLQGQLQAGGDLTLQAQDTVKVRDSAAIPFIASSGGNLLVQGNLGVGIFALNHPESGLFSGGDMVLRSSNTVGGDAHYWSGGSFRIEQLDGSLGNLFSPHDPIIRASGDVFIQAYRGASLHILAGGKVEIPDYVWIQGADPENGLVETVNLADGTTVSINGKSEPTLDIRAGVNPDVFGGQILTLTGTGTFIQPAYVTPNLSSADIKIGTILFTLPDNTSVPLAGRVLLTNQYQPNVSLSGDIQVTDTEQERWGAIFVGGGAGNPSVAINSRGGITLDGTVNTSSSSGDGGDITLTAANGSISTGTLASGSSSLGNAGAIHLQASGGSISTGDLRSFSSYYDNAGSGGAIHLQASDGSISTGNLRSYSLSLVGKGNANPGGAIHLQTSGGSISTGTLESGSFAGAGNAGSGGAIHLQASDGSISTGTLNSGSTAGAGDGNAGSGGAIHLQAIGGSISTGNLRSNSSSFFGNGNAGSGGAIHLQASGGSISTDNLDSSSSSPFGGNGNAGSGGAIHLQASDGSISTGSLSSSSYASNYGNAGSGGAIYLQASDGSIFTSDLDSFSYSDYGNAGEGGNISLFATNTIQQYQYYDSNTSTFKLSDSSINSTGKLGSGNITITSHAPFVYDSGIINSDTFGPGKGGDILISAPAIILSGGAQLSASTHSSGQGGNITLRASDKVELSGATTEVPEGIFSSQSGFSAIPPGTYLGGYIPNGDVNNFTEDDYGYRRIPPPGTQFPSGVFSQTTVGSTGSAGNLRIETKQLNINNGAAIATTTFGEGNAGNIWAQAYDSISVANGSILSGVAGGAIGNSGNIDLSTRSLSITTGGTVQTQTLGQGKAGNIQVNATDAVTISGINPTSHTPSGLRSGSGGSNTLLGTANNNIGQGGDINVKTGNLRVADGGVLDAQTLTNSRGGDITVNANTLSAVNGGRLLTSTSSGGQAGSLSIEALQAVTISGNGQLSVETSGAGAAGNVTVNTPQLTVLDGGNISATATEKATSTSRGGSIEVNVSQVNLRGNNSGIFAQTEGAALAGSLRLQPSNNGQSLTVNLQDNAQISASTSGSGQGGSLSINAPQAVTISGNGQLSVEASGAGAGGNLTIDTQRLTIQDGAQVSASTSSPNSSGIGGNITVNATQSLDLNQASLLAQSNGAAAAGNVTLNTGNLTARNGTIATSSEQSSGGGITITADKIRLFGDSDITTNVNQGTGGGGNIYLEADSILAFDDSDILAFARDGRGGDITLKTPAFFGENYRPAPRRTDPRTLDNNNRVDVNATGAVSGDITTPDTTFIQNSLTELPETQINTDSLLANSCIVRRNQPTRGSFTITGTGGLPQRPGDTQMSSFPTVDVETLPSESTPSATNPNRSWQKGDPIVEPQGVYQLPNGKLLLSRECPQ